LKQVLRILFPAIAILVVLFEWSCSVRANGGLAATFAQGNSAALFYKLFRLSGLAAFTLVAFQVLTGPYMKFWEALYGEGFYRFHAYEGLLALLTVLLHPSLLFISLAYSKTSLSSFTRNIPFQFYFGPLALLLMLVTVSTAGLAVILNRPRFKKGWHAIHLANYAAFILAFFHSVTIGTDLTSPRNPLRYMWVLFFIAMVMGFLYRRCRSRIGPEARRMPDADRGRPLPLGDQL